MFFFSRNFYISSDKSYPINMTKNTSLQAYPIKNLSNTSYNKHHDNVNRKKRTLPFIFLNNHGSMTLEAAIVLPLFLIFMLQLLSAINILNVTMDIESAMHQTAKKMALYAYAYESVIPTDNEILQELASFALSSGYAKTDIITSVGKEYLDNSLIKDGSNGISFLLSEVMKEDKINLIATYQIVPAFSILPFASMTMVQRCQMKAWTGYDNLSNQNIEQIKYVYVTETGTVYHENRNCTHLLLSIETCLAGEVINKRNVNGSAYQCCELCWEKTDELNATVLITQEGNRYHSSLDCSGLKRTISTIPYSEIGNLNPCSRCGIQ